MQRRTVSFGLAGCAAAACILLAVVFQARAGDDKGERRELQSKARETILLFEDKDPGMTKLFRTAHGYAVFPSIGKGGLGIGAAHGKGLVYEKGRLVGEAKMTQITIGAQIGGKTYAEAIFFETAGAMKGFKNSEYEMSAQVSAVAAAAGAAEDAKYQQGVAVFTMAGSGLMGEASVGGQKFSFIPLGK